MEKNTLLAVVVSSLFLVIWYLGVMPRVAPPPPKAIPEIQNPQTPVENLSEPKRAQKKKETLEQTARLSSKDISVTLSSRSAGVKSCLVRTKTGQVDLVMDPEVSLLPLGTFPELAYRLQSKKQEIEGSAIFSGTSSEGWKLEKEYRLQQERPVQQLILRWSNPAKKPVEVPSWKIGWGPGLGAGRMDAEENERDTRIIAFRPEGKGGFLDKFKKSGEYPLAHQWVAIDNRYFLAALFPPQDAFKSIEVSRSKGEHASFALEGAGFSLAPGETKEIPLSLYMGPKGYSRLEKLQLHLERAIDFGFFGFLGRWTLYTLFFFNTLVGNYGWAIVLLTAFLQIVLLPLSIKSFKAAQDMKRIQPQLKLTQEKFKGDPKRLQQEMMGLYRKAGVNPFGGCLPILPQIPIFWALFTTLRNAFELQGAPWILWIRDLSAYDPYYVLPVLMGIGMFAQQKLTTVQADPMQAKMAMIMPVVLTFMFLKFPAGVALYMVTNSLFTLASQTLFVKRTS